MEEITVMREAEPRPEYNEQEMFYANCNTCGWRSDFVEDRDSVNMLAWDHEFQATEAFGIVHKTIIMRCTMISEPDVNEGESRIP